MPRTPTMVNITGIDHAELLMELFNRGHTVGAEVLNDPNRTITKEYASETLQSGNNEVYPYVGLTRYVGWLLAKPILIAFNPENNIDVSWYNHYNGEGAAEAVVDTLRAAAEAAPENE